MQAVVRNRKFFVVTGLAFALGISTVSASAQTVDFEDLASRANFANVVETCSLPGGSSMNAANYGGFTWGTSLFGTQTTDAG